MAKKLGSWFKDNYQRVIVWALAIVPILVSLISTIHVVNFFQLSNYHWLAVTLAVAFEIGALSSLAALAIMDKISKVSLWIIFILIMFMQMMGNTYYAFDFITDKMHSDPEWTMNWIELFSIQSADVPTTKRLLAIVSGAILPIVSLSFLHILIGYLSKMKEPEEDYEYVEEYVEDDTIENIDNMVDKYSEDINIDYLEPNENLIQAEVLNKKHKEEISEKEYQKTIKESPTTLVNSQYCDQINDDNTIDLETIKNVTNEDLTGLIKTLVPTIDDEKTQKFIEYLKDNTKKNPKGKIDLSEIIKPKFNLYKPLDKEPIQVESSKKGDNIGGVIEGLNQNIKKQKENKDIIIPTVTKEDRVQLHYGVPENKKKNGSKIKQQPNTDQKLTTVLSNETDDGDDYLTEEQSQVKESKLISQLDGQSKEDVKGKIKPKSQKKKILLYREKKN